jgi:hypothetical protein
MTPCGKAFRFNLRDFLIVMMGVTAIFGMDGQTTGLGLMDFDVNDPESLLYTDKSKLPSEIPGMSHELKNLIKCVDNYHSRTPVDEQAIIEVHHPSSLRQTSLRFAPYFS